MSERALDHVGIAVQSLGDSLPLFESITGGKGYGREVVESQGVEVVFVGSGEGRLELLAPVRDDSAVAKYLARRGPAPPHPCRRGAALAARRGRPGPRPARRRGRAVPRAPRPRDAPALRPRR